MHKKMAKAITGSFLAATMAASVATQFVAPMSASAGNMLGQSTFDDGIGLPWHVCETNPAKQTFEIENGKYTVSIVKNNGGDGRWDLQLRHRKLKIQSGHQYKISWEITPSANGYIYSKIGNYEGDVEIWHDLGAGEWQPIQLTANQTAKGSSTFTANQNLDVAEWAFHYANNNGQYGNNDTGMPDGSTITFDNLTLECMTCGSASGEGCNWDVTDEMGIVTPRSDVRINQVGYYSNLVKKASYATDSKIAPVTFVIKDSSGKVVYDEGTVTDFGQDPDSGEYVQILDFTGFTTTGQGYYIEVSDDTNTYTNPRTGETYEMWKSHPFAIANPSDYSVYDGVLENALNYYYQNRSGVSIDSAYITSGDKATLAHQAGHVKDMAYVQSAWVKSYAGDFSDGDKTYQIDGTGGWYDAGDHGKYVVNGGVSVWTLQNMYELSKKNGTDAKWTNGAMTIPESGDANPDILDEARVELEWMFKMMVKSSDPYWGKYENLVYHKLHDHKWTGLAVKAWDYEEDWGTTRIVKPPTFAATLNMAATAAQAARLWKGIDDAFAEECLANAKLGYEAVKKHFYELTDAEASSDYSKTKPLYAPLDQAIGGGGYGDTYVKDDLYWAACELYATTGDKTYYTDLAAYENSGADKAFSVTTSLGGGENNGSFSSFNWGCTAGLGTLTLYLNQDKLEAADVTKVENAIVAAADEYIAEEAKQGMGTPYHGATFTDLINIGPDPVTGYEWGSNSFVINNAIVMAYAYDIEGTNNYISGVSSAIDYIFGRNGLGISYVTGYGTYHTSNPHHRYWSYELDKNFPMAPAGVMSGGPGAGLQDPYVGGLGYKRGTVPSQKCYVDSIEAWSVNEVTINWNAPFAWVISFLEDEIEEAPTPDAQPTTGNDDDLLWGDANDNGEVEVADAVFILQKIADPSNSAFDRTERGDKQANCKDPDGSGVESEDAMAILQFKADLIGSLPV